jgi:hypothetical protein
MSCVGSDSSFTCQEDRIASLIHRVPSFSIGFSDQPYRARSSSGSADDGGLPGFGLPDRPHPDTRVPLADAGDETPVGGECPSMGEPAAAHWRSVSPEQSQDQYPRSSPKWRQRTTQR